MLEMIAKRTIERVNELKNQKSLQEIKKEAESLNCNTNFPFEKALKGNEISFICEIKKASPSKGVIDENFPYLQIAKEYEEAGASAISVLTEPYWFLGSNQYLKEISSLVNIPVLRKDFTVDSYQIYEAKLIGASAILLICSLLDTNKLKEYLNIAHSLGLSAIVESHTEEEVSSAISSGAKIIGVNNRDLKTFKEDITTSIRLRKLVPKDIIFISESCIKTREDIKILSENNVNAVLIGETLMKSKNKKELINTLRGKTYE
ncbi:indole-3-glycerol phosphate synthase TrpC [Anaerovorax odorimutans]|uniref:indole-3-glycerol phosphate synthase TrpC n=1 Tax=Anaerovorax odorimutans TaxID=109327 RepID=UPI00042901E5|nr:indole-3-glycerol phosphate synthase TrpC [Anaerovorax odorimutans]